MPICLRCGEKFKNSVDINLPICPKCRAYESERGFISCRQCNTILESDEAIEGLCSDCRSLTDEEDDRIEFLSFEELQYDELEDDFDN